MGENKSMRIGLIRHFEVLHPHKAFMSSYEFSEWVRGYDNAQIQKIPIEMGGVEWQICYTSDIKRAVETAKMVYEGEIIESELLRELSISPVFNTKVKLPYIIWMMLGRFAGLLGHKSQVDIHTNTKKRVSGFISNILSQKESNILIVSHGGIMWYIKNELLSIGFDGPNFTKAKNGYLYTFERNTTSEKRTGQKT